jgi:Family of unknown function (DUF6152)
MINGATTTAMQVDTAGSTRLRSVTLAVAVLVLAPAALAHHSFAMFDATQSLTVQGTVKELQWGNPHTWLEVVVANADGSEKSLSLELNGLSGLRQGGWKPGSLRPSDKVTVTYHPMRDGTPAGQLIEVLTQDGQTLKGQ